MGLARVQNDCKTKWIPNIWKNEEKGGITCEALARADVWVPLHLPWSGGRAHRPASWGSSCAGVERKGTGISRPTPEWSESFERADQGHL